MKSLKDAIEETRRNLQIFSCVKHPGISLAQSLELIKLIQEFCPVESSAAVAIAKRLCEVISDCASIAEYENLTPFAKDLRCIAWRLSLVVAPLDQK